jgi:hypothetical protein
MVESFMGLDLPEGGSVLIQLIEFRSRLEYFVILKSDRKVSSLTLKLQEGASMLVPELTPELTPEEIDFIEFRLNDWLSSMGKSLRVVSP